MAFWSCGVYLGQRRKAKGDSERTKKGWMALLSLAVGISVVVEVVLLLTTGMGAIDHLYVAWFGRLP